MRQKKQDSITISTYTHHLDIFHKVFKVYYTEGKNEIFITSKHANCLQKSVTVRNIQCFRELTFVQHSSQTSPVAPYKDMAVPYRK